MNKILRKIRKTFYLNQIRPGPRFGRLPSASSSRATISLNSFHGAASLYLPNRLAGTPKVGRIADGGQILIQQHFCIFLYVICSLPPITIPPRLVLIVHQFKLCVAEGIMVLLRKGDLTFHPIIIQGHLCYVKISGLLVIVTDDIVQSLLHQGVFVMLKDLTHTPLSADASYIKGFRLFVSINATTSLFLDIHFSFCVISPSYPFYTLKPSDCR